MDQVIISTLTGVILNDPTLVKIQQYNCYSYISDQLKSKFGFLPPILVVITFLFTAIVTVGNIVVEKQSKMKV